jgi:hypothetical protein
MGALMGVAVGFSAQKNRKVSRIHCKWKNESSGVQHMIWPLYRLHYPGSYM